MGCLTTIKDQKAVMSVMESGEVKLNINLHNLSILRRTCLFIMCIVCFGCVNIPIKSDAVKTGHDWKTKVKKVVFYVDEYPDWQAQEMVSRIHFTITNPEQIRFLADGVDIVTERNRIGASWLEGYLTSLNFLDNKGNVLKNVDIGRNGCIVYVQKNKNDHDGALCYYNRPLCLAVYGFMEIYANKELKDQRSWYDNVNKHILLNRPAYPWDSLDDFGKIWAEEGIDKVGQDGGSN